jgi:hypothetical protein
MPTFAQLREQVHTALEAARREVVTIMEAKGHPLSLVIDRMAVLDNDDLTGWSTQWRQQEVSGLRNHAVQVDIGDDTVPGRVLGLRPQLLPLAERLDHESDLGTRPAWLYPASSGADAILTRYVVPLAMRYLIGLRTLAQDEDALIDSLTTELLQLIEPDSVSQLRQLPLAGIGVDAQYAHRDVTIRPLTELERGTIARRDTVNMDDITAQVGEFQPSVNHIFVSPRVLVEITTTRPRSDMNDQSTLARRVALAILLDGHEIAGHGVVRAFDLPIWASPGISGQPLPLGESLTGEVAILTEADWKRIVDLALKIPDFGPSETSRQEIVLQRLLRGFGASWQDAGFLDFVVCLEAALLGVDRDELTYRFKLYGSLFLRDRYDPKETFDRLGKIYKVRSKLVHGSPVAPTTYQEVRKDAKELALAVVKKCVGDGWPSKDVLNEIALSTDMVPTDENAA